MLKPRLLDLFCGVGGCTKGYQRAGFYVVGVDINRQPNYCGDEFFHADAMTFPLDGFDAIHASPPCKPWTVLRKGLDIRFPALFEAHPDLVTPTLERFNSLAVPWVIENTPEAPLPDPLLLCGSMFALKVRRHRIFASNIEMDQPQCRHAEQGQVLGVYGNGGSDANRAKRGGGGGVKVAGREAAEALGIDWTEYQPALAQAIPPAYTEFIGEHLMSHLKAKANA